MTAAAPKTKPTRPRRRPRFEEAKHQATLMTWAARYRVPEGPDVEPGAVLTDYLYAIPNGGRRNKIEAARLKAEGVKAGVSDLHLPIARGGFVGLWIELKADEGREQPSQRDWRERMTRAGHRAVVCRGWAAAMDEIRIYLENRCKRS